MNANLKPHLQPYDKSKVDINKLNSMNVKMVKECAIKGYDEKLFYKKYAITGVK
jgi:hypothetical protein